MLVLTVGSALVLASAAHAQGRRLTPEMLWEMGRVSDLQVSPDGRFVLYHLRRYELADNRGRTELRRLDRQTGEDALLLDGRSASNARWSPDGARLAFVAPSSGGAHEG
ncbi:MAG: TolB family protein, partial [Planctomycetota bacterium]